MEGLPSGDIQAKYQKLASEYSKVLSVTLLSLLRRNTVGNLCKFIISVAVEGAREGVKEGRVG